MSTSVLEALPGKLDIKRHSPSILYLRGGLIIKEQELSLCNYVSQQNINIIMKVVNTYLASKLL